MTFITLLEQQERYQTAWQRYLRTKALLTQEGLTLTPRTLTLVKRIRKQMLAQEAVAVPLALVPSSPILPSVPVCNLTSDQSTMDEATWFALKQAEMTTLVNQWSGYARQCDELQARLAPLLTHLDTRHPSQSQEVSQFARRQVLISLASLPLALLASGQEQRPSPSFAEEFLPQCAAGIMACRQLMKGQDFFPAEQILRQYLPPLEALMQRSSSYQSVAAHLALQCDILAGILASHRLQWNEGEQHCKHAISFSQLSSDSSLQVTVRIQLANIFSCSINPLASPSKTLEICQEVLPLLEASSPLTQSNFYVHQAASYASCSQEQDARKSLERAHACFPAHPEDDSAFLYADFGASSFFLWEGIALLELARRGLAQPKEAWETFAQVANLDANVVMSERNRIEIVNHQAGTAIVMGELDSFCTYLQRGIEGATRLGSAKRRQEATSNYWQARKRWPQEARVKELAELFMQDAPGGEVLA